MKRTGRLPFFIVMLIISLTSYGQCDFETLTKTCISKLPPGFNFLKSYKVDSNGGAKDKVEFSYVFTKGTQYIINMSVSGQESKGITITLFDSDRNKVATSNVNNQLVSAIAYPCNATGIYYIQYSFDKKAECGSSALGFKR